MPDKRLIQKKITEILKQLSHLKELSLLKDVELFGEAKNLYFAERVMERLIGAAIDINMHLSSDISGEIPVDYFQSFLILAKLKILPYDFAKKIAPSTSLRNILVHEYQNLDENRFRDALKQALKDYHKYAQHIQKFLDTCK